MKGGLASVSEAEALDEGQDAVPAMRSLFKHSRVASHERLARRLESVAQSEVVEQDKRRAAEDWRPEYTPESILPPGKTPDTVAERTTRTSLAMITKRFPVVRKTKLFCTLGPACWSEDTLAALIHSGMNVARFNFSHGDHAGHQEVLDRVRKVAAQIGYQTATMLDTKGPEVRTAMLKDGKDILLTAGQDIIVVSVGSAYTKWEGYKDEATGETKIGCSYEHLCRDLKPGNRVLIADGTICIEVKDILSDTELKGTVLNDRKLGQRKNMNLQGVHIDIPVLTPKDVDDVINFACRNDMDFIAASFVQTPKDIRFIRRVLSEGGKPNIQIIAKIESLTGLQNYDEILALTDGIMVARGDLGMEIPSEKVALAQKMMITKANIAGKFVLCATEMLASMQYNPLPTRAEMTDVANAVFDGVDAVMLSGETANGSFPASAVATMAAIVENAELGVDYNSLFSYLHSRNAGLGQVTPLEATLANVARMAVEFSGDADGDGVIDATEGCIAIVLTETGVASTLVAKYRPQCPVMVVCPERKVLRQTQSRYGLYRVKVDSIQDPDAAIQAAIDFATGKGMIAPGKKAIIAMGTGGTGAADWEACIKVLMIGGDQAEDRNTVYHSPYDTTATLSLVSTRIALTDIVDSLSNHRETKIFCTLGPKCWSEKGLGKLIDAGLNVARFNFSHGEHSSHQEVLDRFRKVAAAKGYELQTKLGLPCTPKWAVLLDTKGPEIRTAMLRGHGKIQLKADQDVTVVAVGADYTTWEGFKDDATGETKIGISYAKLCRDVKPGNRILIADGTIVIEVVEITSASELKGKVLNTKELGERKNVNLPGVHVDIPVLTEKDIDDLTNFCCKNKMDYVAASFVQSGNDVRFIRRVLNEGGGANVKIICKIENEAGLNNYDEILAETDGIMVARGDLGMEIPSEKVCLAQKFMITKAQLAGKFVVTATQMLASMEDNPLPTRAEMTDVANAVFDGTDAVMLSGETANGAFPETAVATMAAIVKNAEAGINTYATFNFICNFTPKPLSSLEATTSAAVKAVIDMGGVLLGVVTNSFEPAMLAAKYRPPCPILVVTNNEKVALQCNSVRNLIGIYQEELIDSPVSALYTMTDFAIKSGIADLEEGNEESDQIVLITGRIGAAIREDFIPNEARFMGITLGDEASDAVAHTSPMGDATISYRTTKVGLDLLEAPVETPRKTKVVCTLGPKCWGEETLGEMMDAGMNVARFNFSHGDHAGHQEVLDRVRRVATARKSDIAVLLDTKGPEIRTAMLRDGKDIHLTSGQDITIASVGASYTEWQGYKDEATGETKIGLSYDRLCQTVSVGNRILIADGTIVITVEEILNDKELRGKVLNSNKLGQRKNVNLPGVHVDIPVLTKKDINDLQEFCCKNRMDYVAASFVQTANDVRFVRRVLEWAGGKGVKIVCKIENEAGLRNYDAILRETDGIMVARGDLGMEIPAEKVAIAQKLMITRANLAGKFVITATQMMASMETNPLPTRAEMTDVANAVFDGTDAVMLSGETANGEYPVAAVTAMAAIAQNAEDGVNAAQAYTTIRDFVSKPVSTVEAVVSAAAKNAIDTNAGLIIVVTSNGDSARAVSKYRPPVPILVITDSKEVVRHTNTYYGQYPYYVESLPFHDAKDESSELDVLLDRAREYAVVRKMCPPGRDVIVVSGVSTGDAESLPSLTIRVAPGVLKPYQSTLNLSKEKVVSARNAAFVTTDEILSGFMPPRKTKIFCTLGPACWSEEGLAGLIDAGLNVARFNFSHGDHASHKEVLDRVRKVSAEKGRIIATMLDTKGPEVRTAMLKDGKDIQLAKGQAITVVAVGDEYTSWEGFKDEESGETRIGCSYAKLARSVKPGNRLLIADGTISIEVERVISDTEVVGKVLNSRKLGQRKNMNLQGVLIDIPVLTAKDIEDVKFGAANGMDFISASFVQTADDVRFIRRVLEESGAGGMKIIAKIESLTGLVNYDAILKETDGIMAARGDLAMEIPSEKVALAQKYMMTKAQVAGKFLVCATEMLASMQYNPLPTRAEMTDVANAVWDGAAGVMLSGETANGAFPSEAVATMARIVRNAAMTSGFTATASFIKDHTPKPLPTAEAVALGATTAAADARSGLLITISERTLVPSLISKYRLRVPNMVVSTVDRVLRQTNGYFGQYPVKVEALTSIGELVARAKAEAVRLGAWDGNGAVVVVHGRDKLDSGILPIFHFSK